MNSYESARCVAVYCASSFGNNPLWREVAHELGEGLARAGFGIVYGGASVGLMGVVADAALDAGGEVIGVLPTLLATREVAHHRLTRLIPTTDMHQRKATMIELAQAVVTLPGGYGTLDELMEALTWAQFGIHRMPCILVNTLGYYDALLAQLDRAVAEGFLRPHNRQLLLVADSAAQAIEMLKEQLA